ncbi:MAG: hypothetical protein ACREM8_02675 [Vulcanimicrobiaceae bacterium]
MNTNDALERALAQARELQHSLNEAVNKTAEQMRPILQESVKNAQELQATLTKHAAETSQITAKQTQATVDQLQEFIKIGSQAMRDSAEQTRAAATKMMEHSRKIVETAAAAMGKKPGDGNP